MKKGLMFAIGFFALQTYGVERTAIPIQSFDGFSLESVIELPEKMTKTEVKNLVIFVHGSGPQNLDEDLTELTATKNAPSLFFRSIADALLEENIASLRKLSGFFCAMPFDFIRSYVSILRMLTKHNMVNQ